MKRKYRGGGTHVGNENEYSDDLKSETVPEEDDSDIQDLPADSSGDSDKGGGTSPTGAGTDSTSPSAQDPPASDNSSVSDSAKETEDDLSSQDKTTPQKTEIKPSSSQDAGKLSSQSGTDPASEMKGTVNLKDDKTSVRVVDENNALAAQTAMKVRALTDNELPSGTKESVSDALAKEKLEVKEEVFYDIDLNGAAINGKVCVWLPVPDTFTGELDAWYVDDNGNAANLTYDKSRAEVKMEGADKYYVFETDHFSIYGLTSSEAKKETTAKKAARNIQRNATEYENLGEAVEQLYGENGTADIAEAKISYSGSDKVKTGQTVSFDVNYHLYAAHYYNYGDQGEPMFDTYDDTRIILRLPKGMSVQEGIEGTLQNVDSVISPDEQDEGLKKELGLGDNDWIFVLDKSMDAKSDNSGLFTVSVKIGGNGEYEAGHLFDFGSGGELMRVVTDFTIQDRVNGTEYGDSIRKTVAAESSVADLTAVTDDVWKVEKTAVDAVPDGRKEKITVTFRLVMGLEEGGVVTTNERTYGREGRVPLKDDTITLTETPEVLDRDGNIIEAESITVIPEFGDKKPIQGTNGVFVLPVDTCKGHAVGDNVAADAPYLSQYTVEVVYPYDKFIANYYDENQDLLEVKNTAEISYTLEGMQERTSKADALQQAGEVTQPAKLVIGKDIVGYEDSDRKVPYTWENFDADDPVQGAVTYKITDEDGKTPTLYKKDGDTYQEITGANGTISYDPSTDQDNLTGQVTVYLDPGTYTVSEIDCPENTSPVDAADGDNGENGEERNVTIDGGGSKTTTFYNQELLGKITVQKSGLSSGNEAPLEGAEFTLYEDEDCEKKIASATTDQTNGQAVFARLPYGTYYVKETGAPAGYIPDSEVHEVTVADGSAIQTVESVNKYNLAYVKLQKQSYDINNKVYVNVNASNYQVFDNCFEIQQKTSENSWKTVSVQDGTVEKELTGLGLTQNGTIIQALPVYEEDGKTLITYRFREVLPEGWHAKDEKSEENGQRVVYSEGFNLKDYLGKGQSDAKTVTMQNDRWGSIDLTKYFYNAAITGMTRTSASGLEATFQLYYQDGENGAFTSMGGPVTLGAGEKASFMNLPRTGENDSPRYYYLVETDCTDGYLLSQKDPAGKNNAKYTTITVGGKTVEAIGPFNFTEKIQYTEGSSQKNEIVLEQSAEVNNVQQRVPVVIKKVNSYTKNFMSGSAYSISYAEEGKTDIVVSNQEITVAAGSLAPLEPGHTYKLQETKVPDNSEGVKDTTEQKIDLTSISRVDVDTKASNYTYTIENRPYPMFKVTKVRDNASGSDTTLTGVVFELYTKSGNSFVPVEDAGGTTRTITAGANVQIKEGTYYLKEIVPDENPNEILNPSEYPDLYTGKGEINGESFYFGPYTVEEKNPQTVQDMGAVVNYSAKGDVTVTKYRMTTNGTKAVLPGAEIGIYTEGSDEPLQTGTSAQTAGQVQFKDLPIYDETGKKIQYTIREIQAPEGYTKSDETLTVELKPGETVAEDTDGKPLEIINQPETALRVNKWYHNAWEYQFSQRSFGLPGTVFALYKKDTDENYVLEMDADGEPVVGTVDASGGYTFEGLTQKDEYVAVEVCVPSDDAFKYLEPNVDGDVREYLNRIYLTDGKLPSKIEANDLDRYSYACKPANLDENNPMGGIEKDLFNVESWAQLHIFKYVLRDSTAAEGEKVESPVNNAEFILYQEIVQGDQTELTFEADNLDKYTVIGSYSSGTLYDENGNRMSGWFGTDILKSAANVVYWLVELDAGIGAEIKPENAVTLIKREGTEYTNKTIYDGKEATSIMDYKNNAVTEEDLENDPVYGPGGDMFSTVRIAKWGGERTEDGEKIKEYHSLGNATFEVWLADAEGNLVAQIDTMTTGLDNNLSGGSDGSLSGWASSKAFMYNSLSAQYEKELPEELYKEIFIEDESGDCYVRIAIRESSAPTGYMMDRDTFYMYMAFQHVDGNGSTEVFNDAYYVKGDGSVTGDDAGVALAEDQNETPTWAFYPTAAGGNPISGLAGKPDDADTLNQQYRMVNWPVDTFAVTVKKYGYDVQPDNIGLGSEGLDEYYASGTHTGQIPLKVTMRLDRLEGQEWKPFAYTGSHANGLFTTGDDGYFAFPNGLPMGYYRIVETEAAPGFDMIYDGSRVTDDIRGEAAYYFQVSADNVSLNMYNPRQVALDIRKTDMDDKPVTGNTFTLTDQENEENTYTVEESTDGKYSFAGISSGTYKLTETAADGYTALYFEKCFREQYKDSKYNGLAGLVDGDGIFLGYKKKLVTEEYGISVAVASVTDLSDYGIDPIEGLELKVENPGEVNFTIKKIDEDTKEVLNGAQFKVEYKSFSAVSGDITESSTSGWTTVSENLITAGEGEKKGLASYTGDPGIYRITEMKAPSGYDITDSNPKYLALTGGLRINSVKVDGTDVPIDSPEDHTVVFEDSKQVSLTVQKSIDQGNLTGNVNGSFTFTLYKDGADKSKVVIDNKQVSVSGTGTGSAVFTGLSQGVTYYLKETSSPKDFVLTSLKTGDREIKADADGYYAVTMSDKPTDVTVDAVNKYLHAAVTILKADGETGRGLSDAEFEVFRETDEGKKGDPVNINFTESGTKPGEYTADFPLSGLVEETFRIYEKTAPAYYLKDEEHYISVTVKAGDDLKAPVWVEDTHAASEDRETNNEQMLNDRIFPNYRGAYVDLVKYDNIHSMKDAPATKAQAGAGFTLYQQTDTGWIVAATSELTREDGAVHFTVNGGNVYALAETTVPSGYEGLEGIWTQNTDDKTETKEVTIGGQQVLLHLINKGGPVEAGETYGYHAYDIPHVPLEIRKRDALDPSKSVTAVAAVYALPDDTSAMTNQEVKDFLADASKTPLLSNINVNVPKKVGDVQYNYADNTRLAQLMTAGKSYLVVEESAGTSQIRDDRRVTWYQVIQIPEGSRETQTATLANVEGTASLSLEKTVKGETEYTNLFTRGTEITYQITPTVGDNTYPLNDFTLTDIGLSAYDDKDNLLEGYLDDNYSLNQVVVGKSSHVTGTYAQGVDNEIYATVTFYDGEGKIVFRSQPQEVTSSDRTVQVMGAVNRKVARVTVEYSSPDYQEATGYALGTGFTPGPVTVTAVVDRQEGGANVEPIKRIRNTSEAELHYQEWTTAGVKEETQKEIKKTATADVTFAEQETARVQVTKKADKASVKLEETVDYTITITNTEDGKASMDEPFIVDMLPQGTIWQKYDADHDVLLNAYDTGITLSEVRTQTVSGETGVFIFLDGSLEPGESVDVTLKVMTGNTVTSYGTSMTNYAIAGSGVKGAQSVDNPQSSAYQTADGLWPYDLRTALSTMSADRKDILAEILGEEMAGFGYVAASTSVNWTTSSMTTQVKSAYGDRNPDTGYVTDILSTVSNGGTMHYRLTIANSSDDFGSAAFSLIDILPAEGDITSGNAPRDSKWELDFDEITSVYVNTVTGNVTQVQQIPENQYQVFYYTGDGEWRALYDDVKSVGFATDATALPAGWTSVRPSDGERIRAFILAVDDKIRLDKNESLVVEYTAEVNGGKDFDPTELNENSYQNAVNSFSYTYSYYKLDDAAQTLQPLGSVLGSNSVSNTILPAAVSVAGHVWIDKDNDGVWEEGESIDNFADNTLIGRLLESMQIRLDKYSGTSTTATGSETYTKGAQWKSNAEFMFDNLDPAMIKEGFSGYNDGILDPAQLKGSAPATYRINITLPESTSENGKFKVTKTTAQEWISRDPVTISTDYPAEMKDNNFTASVGAGSATSEQFYLWATDPDVYDSSKDIGIVPYRDLKITKRPADDLSKVTEGATFEVRGSFPDGATSKTLTTGSDGTVLFEDLLWFEEYTIIETSAPTGYEQDGAELFADGISRGTNIERIADIDGKPAWKLKVPASSKENATDSVTITNARKTEVTLRASKELLKGGTAQTLKEDQFQFELYERNSSGQGATLQQTKGNAADGSVTFDKITISGTGEYVYYIRENSDSPAGGIDYDDAVYRAVVSVSWKEGTGLVAAVNYDKRDGQEWKPAAGNTAKFTNTYDASGSLTLTAEKTVNGVTPTQDEKYQFTLTPADGALGKEETVENNGRAVTFTPIGFELKDVRKEPYVYTIKEQAFTGRDGYSPDTAEYTVSVVVSDKGDGKLGFAQTITKKDKPGSEEKEASAVTFDNTYTASGSWTPAGTKKLTGRKMTADDTFEFAVYETKDGMVGTTPVSTGIARGTEGAEEAAITFTPISYTQDDVGEHLYRIIETSKGHDGIADNQEAAGAAVTVEDNVRDGRLEITAIINSKPDGSVVFTNTYQAEPVVYTPLVTKIVSGGHAMPEEETFTFSLEQIDKKDGDGVTLPENADEIRITVSENGQGIPVSPAEGEGFGGIRFEKEGTYTFRIQETGSALAGYTKDPHTWTLSVEIRDDGKGRLYVAGTPTYTRDDHSTGSLAAFENVYKPSETKLGLKVSKTVTGNEMPEEKEFTFTLTPAGEYGDQIVMPDKTTAVIKASATGKLESGSFDEITFKKAGTYYFDITENQPKPDAGDRYEYDKTVWKACVTVTDQGGSLKAEAVYYTTDPDETETSAEFKNKYDPDDTGVTPKIRKNFTGHAELPDDVRSKEFTFTLTADENNAEGASLEAGKALSATVQTGQMSGSMETTFDEIRFSRKGTYLFYMNEEGTDGEGFIYDKSVWTLTVEVKDEGGRLSAETTYSCEGKEALDTEAEFTNSYDVDTAEFTPYVVKTFTAGSDSRSQEQNFKFELVPDKNNKEGGAVLGDGNASLEASVTGTGKAQFDEITFKKWGTYTFVITEKDETTEDPGDPAYGYSYDKSEWILTVTLEDKGGRLEITDSAYQKAGSAGTEQEAVFTNGYHVDPTGYTPAVAKLVTGDGMPDGGKDFIFCLTTAESAGYEGVTIRRDETVVHADQTGTQTGGTFAMEEAGTEPADAIGFAKAGTYQFFITEKDETTEDPGSANYGYTYSDVRWTLNVTVEDKGGYLEVTDTEYTAKGEETSGTEAFFENEYHADPAEFGPQVKKRMSDDSDPVPSKEKFVFELKAEEQDGAVLPAECKTEVEGAGTGSFDHIRFDKAGVYTFTITEQKGSADGYTYDGTEWTLTVTVEDQGGYLAVTGYTYEPAVTGADSEGTDDDQEDHTANRFAAEFVNSYHPEKTTFAPRVSKSVAGDVPAEDSVFRFCLVAGAGEAADGAVLPDETEVSVEGSGSASFDSITFTKAGTYTFAISEIDEGAAGYSYDPSRWILTVTVEDENGRLRIVEDETTYASGEVTSDEAEFINEYKYTPTGYTPQILKKITGDSVPQDDQKIFSFMLSADEKNPAGAKTGSVVAKTRGEGSAQFGEIVFTQPGVFKFYIREAEGEDAGYTYDKGIWTLTVIVEDRESQLTVTGTIYSYSDPDAGREDREDKAVFENSYKVTPTEYTPYIEKVIDGVAPADMEKDFTFHISMESGPEDGAVIHQESVTLTGEETKAFEGPVEFVKAGVYTFLITEEKGSEEGYGYDEKAWRLTVNVKDEDSILTQTHSYSQAETERTEAEKAVFTNTYTALPAESALKVTKTVTGDVPEGSDKAFTFTLEPKEDYKDAVEMPEKTAVQITGAGETSFDKIRFTRAGTYFFEIREKEGDEPGYSYDGSVWTAEVTVSDHDHELKADSITYSRNGKVIEDADAASFTNSYNTSSVTYDPKVEKVITGEKRPQSRLFSFTLEAAQDNPEGAELIKPAEDGSLTVAEKLNAAVPDAGNTAFRSICFTKAGTYSFIIRETNGSEKGYTYDETAWNLQVVVEDRDSVLAVTGTHYTAEGREDSSEKAKFINSYNPLPTAYAPEVEKTVTGDVPEGTDPEFAFTLTSKEKYGDEVQLPKEDEVTIKGRGRTSFGQITFWEAGTYRFRIAEKSGQLQGWTYDAAEWIVEVTVEDEDGQLRVTDTMYEKAGVAQADASAALFENVYTPVRTEYIPSVKKMIDGDRTPEDREFCFEISPAAGHDGAGLTSTTAQVSGEGTTVFGKIEFSKPGIYLFNIKETEGDEAGYTYDDTIWVLKVKVEDLNGALEVTEAVYVENGTGRKSETAEFTNIYKKEKAAAGTNGTVKTGDHTDTVLPFILMGVSAAAVITVCTGRRRRRDNR